MKHDKLTQAILAKANTMPAARPFPTKDRPGIKLNKPKAWQLGHFLLKTAQELN